MDDYTTKEKLKIAAGAVCALVIVGWLVVLRVPMLSTINWKTDSPKRILGHVRIFWSSIL
jgi:hypothetical protein